MRYSNNLESSLDFLNSCCIHVFLFTLYLNPQDLPVLIRSATCVQRLHTTALSKTMAKTKMISTITLAAQI